MDDLSDEWMVDALMGGWWLVRWVDEQMGGWQMDEKIDSWLGGWVDGWIYA